MAFVFGNSLIKHLWAHAIKCVMAMPPPSKSIWLVYIVVSKGKIAHDDFYRISSHWPLYIKVRKLLTKGKEEEEVVLPNVSESGCVRVLIGANKEWIHNSRYVFSHSLCNFVFYSCACKWELDLHATNVVFGYCVLVQGFYFCLWNMPIWLILWMY